MGWDQHYSEETDKLQVVAAQFEPKGEDTRYRSGGTAARAWATTVPRSATRGIAETGASLLDVSKGFGLEHTAAVGTSSFWQYLFASDKQRSEIEARDKEVRDTLARERAGNTLFTSAEGTELRDSTKWALPDPQTASKAEQMVFGLGKVMTKVVTGAAVGGTPLVMASMAEEGFTQSEELRQQGVKLGARTAVGSVQAAAGALVPLPLAGATVKGTVGLWFASGPGAFIAQNVASRAILKNAGYKEISDQYDPLDAWGLALSAVPGVPFAALGHMRNKKAAREAKAAELAKQAIEEAGAVVEHGAPVAATAAHERQPVTVTHDTLPKPKPSENPVPREHLDAAMVHNITELNDAHVKLTQIYEAASHLPATTKSALLGPADQIRVGFDAIKDGPLVVVREPQGHVTVLSGADQIRHGREAGEMMPAVELTREQYDALRQNLSDGEIAEAAQMRADADAKMQAAEDARVAAEEAAQKAQQQADIAAKAEPELPEVRQARKALEKVGKYGVTVAELASKMSPEAGNLLRGLYEAGDNKARAERMLQDYQRHRQANPELHKANSAADVVEAARRGEEVSQAKQAQDATKDAATRRSERAQQLVRDNPDMPVGIDERGRAITASQLMERVRHEAEFGTDETLGRQDIKLVETAIQCALNFGEAVA